MSGGSYSYIYETVLRECEDRMHDEDMDELIVDLSKVLHDLEWWQSGDYLENDYRKTLEWFKKKWLTESKERRLKKYIDNQIGIIKRELYALIGESEV